MITVNPEIFVAQVVGVGTPERPDRKYFLFWTRVDRNAKLIVNQLAVEVLGFRAKVGWPRP